MVESRKSSQSLRGMIPKTFGIWPLRWHLSHEEVHWNNLIEGVMKSSVSCWANLGPPPGHRDQDVIIKMTVGLLCSKTPCSYSALISYMSPFHSFPILLPPQCSIQAYCGYLPTARHWWWSWEVTRGGGGRLQEWPREPPGSSLPVG